MTDAATAAAPEFCLDGFLELLRTHRFQIGPDRCLRILRLLSHIDYRCDPSELERLICPLIATSAEEQERFGILFHTYYPFLPREAAESIEERAEITGSHPITGSHRRRPSSGTTIPLEMLTGKPWRGTGRRVGVGLAVIVGMVGMGVGVGPAVWRHFHPVKSTEASCEANNSCEKPPGPDTSSTKASVPPPQPTIDTVLVSLALNEPTTTWYQRNQQWVRGLAMLLPLALLGASELLRRRRRPPPVDDSAGPFFQPLQVPEPGRWYRSPAFFIAARMLRQRQLGEALRLAVEQTISATIDRMGYPTWKYRRDTRPPEYLALIDRTGLRDHQARHFDSLVAGLKREGVILERYFFDGDPRLCHTDGMKEVIKLDQLERRYHGARLLLMGDGYRLLDPVGGELLPWTMTFESWRERAILTPTPPIAWGTPESALEERFPLLAPATTEGLKETVLALALDSGAERRDWKEESSGETPPPLHPERALRELRRALGKPVYRWLCACAVYPELRWDLTVHLGALPGVGANLVTESNLLALARLPWFRQGAIPEPVRAELIADLPEEAKTAVRKELLKLLRHDLPAEGSPARRKFEAEIAVQQLGLATQDPAAAKALKPDLMRAPRDHFLAELEIGGLTESLPPSWVARLVPRRWWPVLFEHGLPAFSMHTGVRLAVTIAAVAGSFLLLPREPIPPSRLEITPDSALLQVGKTTGRIDASSSKTVKYTSRDSAIVSVESGGVLMPHDSGNSVVVAEAGGLSDTLKVRVLSKDAPPPRAPGNRIGELTVDSAVDRTAVVPDLRGRSLNRARQLLAQAGLRLSRVDSVDSGITRPGTIGRQSPSASARVDSGSAVAVSVARGARGVPVPDLMGYTRQAALDTLRSIGLTPSWRFDTFAPDSLFGRVTAQGITAGQVVAAGTEILLTFGAGRLVVPDVVRLTVDSAQAILARAGLSGRVITPDSAYGPSGVVERQRPAAGTRVPPRGIIDLTVSTEPSVQIEQRGPERLPINGLLSDYVGTWADTDDVTYTFGLHLARQPTGTYSGFFVYTLKDVGKREDLRPLVGATGTEFVAGTFDNRTDTLRLVGQAVDDSVLLGTAVYLLHFPSGRSNFSGRTRNTESRVWSGRISGQSSSRRIISVEPTRLRLSVDSLLSDYVGTWANADDGATYTFGLHLARQPTGTYSGFFVYTLKDVGKREDLRPLVGATGTEFVSGTFDNRTDTLRLVGQTVDDSLLLGTAVYLLHLPAGRSNFSGRTRNTNSGDWSGRITGQRSSRQVIPVEPTRRGTPSR